MQQGKCKTRDREGHAGLLKIDMVDLVKAGEGMITKALCLQYEFVTGNSADKALPSLLKCSRILLREAKKGTAFLGTRRMVSLQDLANSTLWFDWVEVQKKKIGG